ncbi:MAG: DUF4097 family beta strand repeat protein [Clostridia bacterium]|nr:DUF4097 family beta strand repeat protein [Clostridia bacterium]
MKTSKKALITACILIAVGLVIGFVGIAAARGDLSSLTTEKIVTNTHTVSQPFSSIDISSGECDVRFLPSDDGTCKVICRERENLTHQVTVEDDTLKIRETDSRKWYEYIHFGLYWEPLEVCIYLPQTEYSSLRIDGSVSDIDIPDTFSFGDVEIGVTTGDITFCAAVEGALNIVSDTGDIDISDTSPASLSLVTDTGDIAVSGTDPASLSIVTDTGDVAVSSVKVPGGIAMKTDTGCICLTDAKCRDINLESNTGDISLSDVIAADGFNILSDTGDVELLACDALSLNITTNTGDVSGSLLSEKIYMASSDTGDIRVPSFAAGGVCEITTDTGDISFS